MHERAARLPPVGACLVQALPPAHLGRVPAVLAVPVDLHLLARPRGSRYVRPSCYGIRCACVLTLRPACLWRSSSAQGTGRAASDAHEGQNHSPSGIRLSAGRRQRLRTPAYRVTDLRGIGGVWWWRTRHMCQPASQESHSSISCALSSRPHLTQRSSASSSELPPMPLIPARRERLATPRGGGAERGRHQRKPILPDSRLTRCARDVLN